MTERTSSYRLLDWPPHLNAPSRAQRSRAQRRFRRVVPVVTVIISTRTPADVDSGDRRLRLRRGRSEVGPRPTRGRPGSHSIKLVLRIPERPVGNSERAQCEVSKPLNRSRESGSADLGRGFTVVAPGCHAQAKRRARRRRVQAPAALQLRRYWFGFSHSEVNGASPTRSTAPSRASCSPSIFASATRSAPSWIAWRNCRRRPHAAQHR